MLGENNPNYNNKWTNEGRIKQSKLVKQRYIERPELKELCAVNKGKKLPETGRKLKEYYKTHPTNFQGRHH